MSNQLQPPTFCQEYISDRDLGDECEVLQTRRVFEVDSDGVTRVAYSHVDWLEYFGNYAEVLAHGPVTDSCDGPPYVHTLTTRADEEGEPPASCTTMTLWDAADEYLSSNRRMIFNATMGRYE